MDGGAPHQLQLTAHLSTLATPALTVPNPQGQPARPTEPPPSPTQTLHHIGPGLPGCTAHVGFKLRSFGPGTALLITLPPRTPPIHEPACTREIFSRASPFFRPDHNPQTQPNPPSCLFFCFALVWIGLLFPTVRSLPRSLVASLEGQVIGSPSIIVPQFRLQLHPGTTTAQSAQVLCLKILGLPVRLGLSY